MKKANLHEAKTHLSQLVKLVAKGEEVIICKAGIPVAKLVPFRTEKKPRVPGAWASRVIIKKDFDVPPRYIMEHFK